MTEAPGSDGRRAEKFALITALYVAQGLPFGFFTLALPSILRASGLSLTAISALGLLNLPWAVKFLWAPYVDHVGSRKAWLLTLQISSAAAALLLSQTQIDAGLLPVIVASFVFSFIAATQDIATDGFAVRALDARERGAANAVQVGAYRIGMILGGGLLLIVFDRTSWSTMFLCMAALLALTTLPVLFARAATTAQPAQERPALGALVMGSWARLARPGVVAFIGLIACFRLGDAMVSSLLGPFVTDQGVSLATIGLMKGAVGSAASLLGAVLGGWFTARVGRRRALLTSGIAQVATFVPYWLIAVGVGGLGLLWTATVVEGVIGTMATVALFSLMMDASDPEHAGTDYTLFACAYVLITFLGSVVAGMIADALGYPTLFAIGIVLALAGALTLVAVLDRKPAPARVASVWGRP